MLTRKDHEDALKGLKGFIREQIGRLDVKPDYEKEQCILAIEDHLHSLFTALFSPADEDFRSARVPCLTDAAPGVGPGIPYLTSGE